MPPGLILKKDGHLILIVPRFLEAKLLKKDGGLVCGCMASLERQEGDWKMSVNSIEAGLW